MRGAGGWRSGESARLLPMWPGFDSRIRCHMWVEFVSSRPCSEGFFSGYSGFLPSSKTNISKLQKKKNFLIVGICNKTFIYLFIYK